jgi:putative effector of murein hydrolase LrgA (UPF0299 family)
MPTHYHPKDSNLDGENKASEKMPTLTPSTAQAPVKFDWKMLAAVALLIVFIREVSVWFMAELGYENLGNLIGLCLLFCSVTAYRLFKGAVPTRLIEANSRILKESVFAFLPICAGVGILLVQLGNDTFKIVFIMLVSTLIPLRLYAYLAKKWL